MEEEDATWHGVAKLSELSDDRPHAASARGVELVLVKSKLGVGAYDAMCPHQGTLQGDVLK